jgi:hypothetical protein
MSCATADPPSAKAATAANKHARGDRGTRLDFRAPSDLDVTVLLS